jgi:hypothetical protein
MRRLVSPINPFRRRRLASAKLVTKFRSCGRALQSSYGRADSARCALTSHGDGDGFGVMTMADRAGPIQPSGRRPLGQPAQLGGKFGKRTCGAAVMNYRRVVEARVDCRARNSR